MQDLVYTFPSRIHPDALGALSLSWDAEVDPFAARRELGLNDALQTIQFYPGALSAAECQRVIALGESLPRVDGRVDVGAEAYRVSHIAWIEPAEPTHWLFHKLGVLFTQAARHYGFVLTGFVDALQYTVYGPGQHFGWHMDLGPGATSVRKLSMTIELSEGVDYTGGELEFINAPSGRGQGAATFFPSYIAHRVKPVESGTRRSLVAWACGPSFC